ncbi:EamA family transporter [Prevotella sp. KH2C16]|uniref:EamA family transporter n=1 Tax=Prevotella sp. KH2C16 TaxID=1855325 RepID=UPI0008EA2846|nr:EamA family transporter [Prevotella sp. KH2C16]SFF92217.1 undecaprenyl phosphate-alpha-L-ara4N flippase subunit ArnE [Prevotella sp. KH2C16]
MRLIITSVIQSILLCGGQVLLKFALNKMGAFSWTWSFFQSQLTNWWWLGCGLCYAAATVLWMYIIKNFPFSMAYPMISLSYVFGMFAAMLFFQESIPVTRWIGVLLIMAGCLFVAK